MDSEVLRLNTISPPLATCCKEQTATYFKSVAQLLQNGEGASSADVEARTRLMCSVATGFLGFASV
jgi:hypothetical protein